MPPPLFKSWVRNDSGVFLSFKLHLGMYRLQHYEDEQDRDVFQAWLDSLKDVQARARISTRLLRLELGNFGDHKSVGGGIWELRIHHGPGYRIYYALSGKDLVLLCEGGSKATQKTDIQRAQERWSDWQERHT